MPHQGGVREVDFRTKQLLLVSQRCQKTYGDLSPSQRGVLPPAGAHHNSRERRDAVREGYHKLEKSHVELLEENEKLRQELYNAQTALKKVDIIARTHKPPTTRADTPMPIEPSNVAEEVVADDDNSESTSGAEKFDLTTFVKVSKRIRVASTPHVLSSLPPWSILSTFPEDSVLLCRPSESVWSASFDRLLRFFPFDDKKLNDGHKSVAHNNTCELFCHNIDTQSWIYCGTFKCVGVSEMYHKECRVFLKRRPDILESLWGVYDTGRKDEEVRHQRICNSKELFTRCCGLIKVKYNKRIIRDIYEYNQAEPEVVPKRKADEALTAPSNKKSKPYVSESWSEHSGWVVLDDT